MSRLISDDIEPEFSPRVIDFEALEVDVADVLSRNLVATRKEAGYSQSKMAKVFGVSLTQYKKYESGHEILKVDTAQKWSLHFGIPFFYLLKGSSYNPPTSDIDQKVNFKWYLANSLSHDDFVKLVEMVSLFSQSRIDLGRELKQRIQPSDVNDAIQELDETMYISISTGLRSFRERFSIAQEKMAELLGVSLSTYQQYERPTQKPRFNILIAGRFYLSTGISPLALLKGTHYSRVRYMQEERMAFLWDAIDGLPENILANLDPLIDGFFKTIQKSKSTTP